MGGYEYCNGYMFCIVRLKILSVWGGSEKGTQGLPPVSTEGTTPHTSYCLAQSIAEKGPGIAHSGRTPSNPYQTTPNPAQDMWGPYPIPY